MEDSPNKPLDRIGLIPAGKATRLLQSYHKLSNKSILRFFVNAKEALGLKSTNAYERLKKELYEIIDNYNPNFTSEYEKLGFREVEQEAFAKAEKEQRGIHKDWLESGESMQGNNLNIKDKFVANNQIVEEVLNSYAAALPKALDRDSFINQITQKDKRGYSTLQTPIGAIQINLTHAWNHIDKGNTYKKDRSLYSGAFLDTLTDPLFIVKQEYIPNPKVSANAREMQNSKLVQIKDTRSIAQDSYVFFKPYKIKDKFNYMVGYAIDNKGEIINTTFIPMSKRDFGRIRKMFDSEALYFKGE